MFKIPESFFQPRPDSNKAEYCRHDRLDLILVMSTVVAIASLLVREIHDPDTWWQVAIGRDILANLEIPRFDHFAAAAFGRSYHDSHWLFQVLLAGADRLGGMKGVGMVMVAIWSATFFCCYRATCRWLPPAASCFLLFLAAMACSERFNSRPDIVTCLFISLLYLRLQEGKYKTRRDLAVLAALQVVWSNSHGLFVIGPFMAGCYFIVAVVQMVRSGDKSDLRASAIATLLLIIASLVTPFGFGGWQYAALLMKESGPNASAIIKSVAELQSPFSVKRLSSPILWPFLLLLFIAVSTTVSSLWKRTVPHARLIIVSAFFMTAANAVRNIPLFALAAAPFVAENIRRLLPRLPLFPVICKGALALGFLAFSWLPFSGHYYQMLGYNIRFGLGVTQAFYPSALPDFLRKIRFTGQVYNASYLGGFCLYHGFLPLIDGRWEVYDETTLARIYRARINQADWEWLISAYDIKGILLPNWNTQDKDLYYRIRNDPRWRLVYEDAAALFWVRI